MGLQSTGVATTGSLPTEGVPLVEQLRRVGRDDEGGRGGVCGKKEKPRGKKCSKKKNLVTDSSVQRGNFATFIVAPLLVIVWLFFFISVFSLSL